METTRRRLLHESNTEGGSIATEMKSYSRVPVPNDGINIYANARINPSTSGPFSSQQEIEIPITSSNFDVCEFSNSYIHLKTRLRIRCTNPPELSSSSETSFDDAIGQNQFVMIGLKASPHIIRDYQFKHNNKPITTTMQSSAVYESFLYSTFKAKSEMANKKFVFSPYDEVSTLDNSLCGVYVPIADLATGSCYKTVDIIIPIREFLAMEAFHEFPNKIFGELRIVFHTTPEAFVYTEVNPITSIRKGIITGKIARDVPHLSEVLAADKDSFDYVHAYEQIGIPSKVQFISGWDSENSKLKYTTQAEFAPYVDELTVQEAWVDVKGYRMSDSALRELTAHFSSNPFTVCAQKVETNTFPSGPEAAGLRTTQNIRFNHTTDIEILHPTDSRQRTIFRNIMADNYQIQIGNQRYPEQLCSTISPQFHEMQIQASDFDSVFEANDEYEHSLTDAMLAENADGTVSRLKPTTDNTSFVPIFQTERSGSGSELWFDGIDRITEKVEINCRPIYAGKNDVYYQGSNTPAPILCLTSESYWIFRLINSQPHCQYVVSHSYEEGYNDPSIEAV